MAFILQNTFGIFGGKGHKLIFFFQKSCELYGMNLPKTLRLLTNYNVTPNLGSKFTRNKMHYNNEMKTIFIQDLRIFGSFALKSFRDVIFADHVCSNVLLE